MGKRSFPILLALALVTGTFSVLPAKAQGVTIPDVVQIDDPVNDANYLNDQALLTTIPPTQDVVTPADVGGTSDLMKVWYSADAETISVNIQLQAQPPATAASYIYRVFSNPGEGSVTSSTLGCLRFFAFVPAGAPPAGGYSGPEYAGLLDYCDKGINYTTDAAEGKLTYSEGPDGTAIMTITVPRSYSDKLADGQVLTTPQAQVQNLHGTGTDGNGQPTATDGNWRRGAQIDNTKLGLDFEISGGPEVKPAPKSKKTPPGKQDPPGKGKKKGCPKGKGKKKGACPGKKTPKPPACPAYLPGEEGAEAELAVVTDAATEEAPLELEFDAPPGGGSLGPYDETASLYQNVQVDSELPEAGLYARYEFPDGHDYDLYLNYADGSTAANSGESQPVNGLGSGSPEGGWEAGSNYESVLGITTADCDGYTARLVSWLTTGGATTLKLWLGEAKVDPNAPGGGESGLGLFYALMGLDA